MDEAEKGHRWIKGKEEYKKETKSVKMNEGEAE